MQANSSPPPSAHASFDEALSAAEREATDAVSALARTRQAAARLRQRLASSSSSRPYAPLADEQSEAEREAQEETALRLSLERESEGSNCCSAARASERGSQHASERPPSAAHRKSSEVHMSTLTELWGAVFNDREPAVSLRKLYSFATWLDLALLGASSLFAFASGLCLPATLYFFAGTMDSVGRAMAGGFNADALLQQSKMMIVVGLVYIVCTAVYTALADVAKARQVAQYKKRYLRAILRQDVGWFDTSNPQELATRFGEAILAVEDGVSFKAMMVLEACYTLLFAYALGFHFGWDVCLVVFAASPIAGVSGAIAIFIALSAGQKITDAYAAAGAIASEALSSMRTVASFGLERVVAERYERKLARAERFGISFVWQAGLAMSVLVASIAVMMCSGLLYGGLSVAREQKGSVFQYAVDMTWGEIFESMGMLDKMRGRLEAGPPPAPGEGGGGEVFGGLGVPDWVDVVGAFEGASAWAASSIGLDRVHYKYCTYDCGDQFNMLNLDFQSTISLVTQEPMPLAARDAFHVAECDSDAFPLEPFLLTCATAGALATNATALRMFLQQGNVTAFAQYAQESGSYFPCMRSGATVLLAIFAVQIGMMHFVLIAQSSATIMKACKMAAPVHKTIQRRPIIDSFAQGGLRPSAVCGAISVRDVTFAYPAAPDHQVCRGYSLEISAGQTAALCGPSGAGKSTIIALIERFYDPVTGAVLLDGVDLRELNVRWLRQQIGLVGQEPVLFVGSVMENIAYGKEGATREEVEEAARSANAHSFIMSNLPRGYDNPVGQGGGMLSGGQKQRIAIARAIVRKPAILLLDEATSALDTASERVVQAAIDTIMQRQRRTTVTIAHRLSTIRNADTIAVVKDGRVVEQGTWDELVAIEGGEFRELARRQPPQTPAITPQPTAEGVCSSSASTAGDGVAGSRAGVHVRQRLASNEIFSWANEKECKLHAGSQGDSEWVFWRLMRLQKRGDGFLLCVGSLFSMADGCSVPMLGFTFTKLAVSLFRTDPYRIESDVIYWSTAYVAIGLIMVPLLTCEVGIFGTTGEHLTRNLRALSIRSLVRQEIGYFDDPAHSAGALTLFLSEKVTLVQAVNGEKLAVAIRQLSTLCFGTWLVFTYGYWQLGAIMLAAAPVMAATMGILMVVVFGLRNPRPSGEGPEAQNSVGSLVGEVVLGIRTVASYGAEHRFYEAYTATADAEARRAMLSSALTGIAVGIGKGTPVVFIGAVSYYGSLLIEADFNSLTAEIMRMFLEPESLSDPKFVSADLTTGCLNAQIYTLLEKFLVPVMVIFFMSIGMGAVGVIVTDSQNALQAARLLFQTLTRRSRIDPTDDKGSTLPHLRGDISIRDVVFAYPAAPDHLICNGYSLEIKAGQTVALCGPSGAGKSTLISLIERFYDPQQGCVCIDGVDLKQLNVRWLRRQIALVGQEPILFLGTVAENIAYGNEGATREMVEEAARSANAFDFVMQNLPHGFSTNVGIRGSMLSGGQKQRIAIARAIVRKPAILLLDEATSALDTSSERIVQAAIDEIMQKQQRTTVMIAHRLSTIEGADLIAVIKAGRVTEQGTHDQLLALNGIYSDLVNAQNA